MTDEQSTGLVDPKSIVGSELIKAANERLEQRVREAAIEAVVCQRVLVTQCDETIARVLQQKTHYQKVIDAISSGNFTVGRGGEMIMNDQTLALGHWQADDDPTGRRRY